MSILSAVQKGDKAKLQELLGVVWPLNYLTQLLEETDDASGRTPLLIATEKNDLPAVEMLLGAGADRKATDYTGRTALHLATTVEMVRLLMQAGLDPNVKDGRGESAFDCAIDRNEFDISLELLSTSTRKRELTTSAAASATSSTSTAGTVIDKQEMVIEPHEFMEEVEDQQENDESTASPKNFKHLTELLNRPMGLSEEEIKCRRENVTKWIDILVQNGAQMEAEDEDGNTPLLLSAKKSLLDVSENLIRLGAKVDSKNKYGESALIVASKSAYRENVKIMLDNRAAIEATDVNGSTPLLVARNKSIAKMLIDQGANKEAVDKEGNDMLLSAAKQGNYTTVEYWLQSGADVNVKNSANDTAFRIAVKKEFTDIMILLVAYGAKIDTSDLGLNDFMETLVGLLECKQIVHSPSQAEMAIEDDNETNFGANVAKQDVNLLALDGGGIRGLVLCEMLLMIEKRRKMLYPDAPTFLSKFQWFSGTSTGSIMALGHVYNGFNAEVGLSLYWHLKNKVFPGIWERLKMGFKDAYLLTEVLQETLGDDSETTLGEKEHPKVVIPTTLANQEPPMLHLMCNYGDDRDGQAGPRERKVWEAARASSAAPFYFPAFKDHFLDGGLLANNPTLDAMTEMHKTVGKEEKIGIVVSLGTGIFSTPINESMSTSMNLKNLESLMKVWSIKVALRVLTKAIVPAATSTDSNVKRAHAWCSRMGSAYFRFNPMLDEQVDLTETNEKVLLKMLVTTQNYMLSNKARIDKMLEIMYG